MVRARSLTSFGLVLLVVPLTVAACRGGRHPASGRPTTSSTGAPNTISTGPGPAAAQATEVAVTATEYSYAAPAEVRGGLVRLTVANAGRENHQALALRLAPGTTVDAVIRSSGASPPGPLPYEVVAGTSVERAGATSSVSFNASPGNYLFACFVLGADGRPHVAAGMVRPFTVSGDNGAKLAPATQVVSATEFAYGSLPTFRVGKNTFSFRNDGSQDHEAALVDLAGTRPDDLRAYFASPTPAGPPPGILLGGGRVAKGGQTEITVDLKAGARYAFACYVPNLPGDGLPHVGKGMVTALSVT